MKRPLLGTILLLSCILLLATACAGGEPTVEIPPSPEPIAVEEPVEEPEEELPLYRYPLTGMPTEERVTIRPIVIMVENSPASRPQTGLDQADIVYEVLAEGDITRFIAVYQSQEPEEIGPVRSIRPYFVEIGAGVDGILVHAGWSQEAMNIMVKGRLNHLDQVYGDHAYYWRDRSRKAPHNVYTSIEKVREGAVNKKFREEWHDPLLRFLEPGEEAVRGTAGTSATSVLIPYLQGYTVGYTYDHELKTYVRLMEDEPHRDKNSGKPLTASNVLIVEASHRIVDSVGRRDVDVKGPGKGYLLQDGFVREIRWERLDGVIRAFDPNGGQREIPLLPGQTWVQIVPGLSKVTFE